MILVLKKVLFPIISPAVCFVVPCIGEIDNKDIGILNYNIFTKELSEDSVKKLKDLGYDIDDIEINLL